MPIPRRRNRFLSTWEEGSFSFSSPRTSAYLHTHSHPCAVLDPTKMNYSVIVRPFNHPATSFIVTSGSSKRDDPLHCASFRILYKNTMSKYRACRDATRDACMHSRVAAPSLGAYRAETSIFQFVVCQFTRISYGHITSLLRHLRLLNRHEALRDRVRQRKGKTYPAKSACSRPPQASWQTH